MYKYFYITAIRLYGWKHPDDSGNITFYESGDGSIKAVLSNDIDSMLYEIDKANAVGCLLLKGFVGQLPEESREKLLIEEIERFKNERKKKVGKGECLIITIQGDCEASLEGVKRGKDGYAFGFDLIDKNKIKERYKDSIASIVTSASLINKEDYRYAKLTEGLYFIDEKEIPHYSITFSLTSNAFVSSDTPNDIKEGAGKDSFKRIFKDKEMEKVRRLYFRACDSDVEPLIAFILSWTALEMFIGKVFPNYEEELFCHLLRDLSGSSIKKYFDKLRNIIKKENRLRLLDKFTVIAYCLYPDTADDDIKEFSKLNGIRNDLLHENKTKDNSFPVKEVIKVFSRYFPAHYGDHNVS